MSNSNNRRSNLFNYLARKVCFTFAVSFFSIIGSISIVPAAVFIWATTSYKTISFFYTDVLLAVIALMCSAIIHYFQYGLGRFWGKRWENKDLRILNDHVKGEESRILPDIPTAILQEILNMLERLPEKNFWTSVIGSMPVLIIVIIHHMFFGDVNNAFFIFKGGMIGIVTYVSFTYFITELLTLNPRREARMILAEREAWEETRYSRPLMIKFLFIIIFIFISMIITHGLSTSKVISSPVAVIIIFSILNLLVGLLMCILVFKSILITLNEIETTATELSEAEQVRFISGGIDREFVNTAAGLYRAAHKIIKYRNDLENLNLNLEQKVKDRTEQIESLLRTDQLTGCFNRRYLIEKLPQEIKKASRYHQPLALIMCDLDHFKNVNDTYGHQVGDFILKEFVQCISEAYRIDIDWVARYGGEEFIIVMPETDLEGAGLLAERIRKVIAERSLGLDSQDIHITVSFGVTGFDSSTSSDLISEENLIREVDRCLYKAKEEGRNRVVICHL
jgi:diguanylate cyclase (GGDEF)-like protein